VLGRSRATSIPSGPADGGVVALLGRLAGGAHGRLNSIGDELVADLDPQNVVAVLKNSLMDQ
jgi:hypothetical protein